MNAAVVMMTRKCNMSCAHCSVASHPGISEEPSAEALRRTVMELGEAGVKGIQFTGGEPLIRHKLLFELMELAHTRYGISSAIVSNGFWGKKPERAEEFFHRLRELGLIRLTISYDRFHAKFMGPQPVRNILEIARRDQWPVSINITRTKQDSELGDLVAPFAEYRNAAFRFYDVQAVGQAIHLEDELRSEVQGFCSGCEQPTVSDNGRMLACNGPSYFEADDSALVLGKTKDSGLLEMLTSHDQDPILQTIRLSGPSRLKEVLEKLPEFKNFPFKKSYSGLCDLCRQICGNPRAVAALREQLAAPDQVALRMAQQQVKSVFRDEVWHREAINGGEARRVFFLTLTRDAERHRAEINQILSRADVDWYRQAEMLARNGVLSKLEARKDLFDTQAPDFFWNFLHQDQKSERSELTLSDALERFKESDFENLLELAVALEESPALLDQLRVQTSVTARLAHYLLFHNGLLSEPEACPPTARGRAWLAGILGQAVVTQQPYQHFSLLIAPALHILCNDSLFHLPASLRRAGRAFTQNTRQCAHVHGWKETLTLLTKDLAQTAKVFNLPQQRT